MKLAVCAGLGLGMASARDPQLVINTSSGAVFSCLVVQAYGTAPWHHCSSAVSEAGVCCSCSARPANTQQSLQDDCIASQLLVMICTADCWVA